MKNTALSLVLGVLAMSSVGCQKYMAIPNSASDRIWMVTQDGTEVFRCWDLKNQTGKLMAICRRAEHVGKTETTKFTEFADSTNPPPHPDSTEICAQPASRDLAHR
ncbi:MAG: hypothetical protein JNM40_06275 [Myxococcales bacterium]|nr:hypothetical protein [Myxococcales bacterium]